MPAAYPEEFRRRAMSLVREDGRSVIQVARELGIAESGLRRSQGGLRPALTEVGAHLILVTCKKNPGDSPAV